MLRQCITALLTLGLLASCGMAIPVIETADSNTEGTSSTAFAAYGLATPAGSGVGITAQYNYGLTDQIDWTTNVSTSLNKMVEIQLMNDDVEFVGWQNTLLTGPKFSNTSGSFALSLPLGMAYNLNNPVDNRAYLLAAPTILTSWKARNRTITRTAFARLNVMGDAQGAVGWPVIGISNQISQLSGTQLYTSYAVTYAGVFVGFGLSL